MSLRHPSEGIAFEPLSVVGGMAGGVLVVATFVLALRRAFRVPRPKEQHR